MANWTKEQLEAIEKTGTNIIVSAGAGSGKTAVLTERVLHKLKSGVHIGELLILTFTRAAADEMKDRIREELKKHTELKSELEALDSAYVTTFDSFALSVVKKYHYLLNINSDIGIADDAALLIEKKRILDEVFENLYKENEENFCNLISKFCVKSDNVLRNNIKVLIDKIDTFLDRDAYFDMVLNSFSDNAINRVIDEYEEFIDNKKNEVRLELENASYYFDQSYVSALETCVLPIINTNTLDELITYQAISLPRVPNGTSDDAKNAKKSLQVSLKNLLSYTEYGTRETIKNDLLESKNTVLAILDIIMRYFKVLDDYKKAHDLYTFQDIQTLAINLLRTKETARLELKNTFKEIMIDEYQDTNDIQETFIGMISSNNVYMVGDIKQSIYRFRGSNPDIFKEKYDNYSKNNGGYKIDLIKNFRSRSEVLNNINSMFDLLMDNDLGGAEYYESHRMKYGLTLYDNNISPSIDYNADILEYDKDLLGEYKDYEVEIFSIANDIKNKMESKAQVFDKKTGTMRDAKYSDFVIILDRSIYFDTYKKVFEYLGIPLTILKDGKLNTSTDILIIRNILDLIIRIKNNDFGQEFKYSFMSIGRSFLYEYTDEYLFDIITNNRFKETTLYEDFKDYENFNSKTSDILLNDIVDITDFFSKINKIGDYNSTNIRISSLVDIAKNLSSMGKSPEEFRDYLDEIIKNNYEIKYQSASNTSDSVKILTIHKSKGLEYPFCYFADLDHKFNTMELSNKFIADKKYGLIVPEYLDEKKMSVTKILYKNEFMLSEISEKIRLFYVALTRAREKIIIVLPSKETSKLERNVNGTIEYGRRIKFSKLSDFIYAFKPYLESFFKEIEIDSIGLSKDYLYNKPMKDIIIERNATDFTVDEINIPYELVEETHFSKSSYNLITKESRTNMDFGTMVHEAFEYADFKNFDENRVSNKFIRDKILKFLNQPLVKDIKNANIYHEYEFYYTKDNTNYHGIIDLMLEYDNHIDIIDYKLKDTTDAHYIDQLNGYKSYIETISNKPVYTYLYSIIDEEFTSI